jgi:hypothetical protein
MLRFINRLFHRKAKAFRKSPPRRSFKPGLEQMEKREVLSTFHKLDPVMLTGSHPQLAAVGHYQGPGGNTLPFVAVTNEWGGSVSVLLGDGQGGFSKPQADIALGAAGAEGIVVGHFTDSGADDLAVASYGDGVGAGKVTLLRGDGQGGFTNAGDLPLPADGFAQPTYLTTATIGGLPYLFVSDFGGHTAADPASNRLLVYQGDGAGHFTVLQELGAVSGPNQIVTADFNGDGNLDLAVANKNTSSVTVFAGNGDGTFANPTIIPLNVPDAQGNPGPADAQAIGLAVGYFDGDVTHPDLAVVGLGGAVQIIQNQSTPAAMNFVVAQNIFVGQNLINIAVTGMGGSFQQDLAVTSAGDNKVYFLKNTSAGPGSFAFDPGALPPENVGQNPVGLVAAKVTASHTYDDLIVVNYLGDSIQVLENQTPLPA